MGFDYRHVITVLRLFVISVAFALVGCSTTGTSFSTSSMYLLTPGQTTLAQASALLQADPVDVYRQGDGSAVARWAHRASFVPDAVYFNRELWLAFDANGYFERIVKNINVPQAGRADHINRPVPANQTMPAHVPPVSPENPPAAMPVRL